MMTARRPDGAHVDNANMSTPPDGMAPTMQLYLQHLPGTSYPDGDHNFPDESRALAYNWFDRWLKR